MTVYVSDTPWNDRQRGEVFNLWADTSDEVIAALYGVGGDLSQRREECNAWEAYAITPTQFADLIGLGVTVTDRFGPAWWIAQRNGDRKMMARLGAARTRGCA